MFHVSKTSNFVFSVVIPILLLVLNTNEYAISKRFFYFVGSDTDYTFSIIRKNTCKYHNNLYIVGELLDVDGICGGYNLHFAFASAYKAALDILEKVGNNNG